jgi:hypothetical protein
LRIFIEDRAAHAALHRLIDIGDQMAGSRQANRLPSASPFSSRQEITKWPLGM